MEIMSFATVWLFINLTLILSLAGLGIYALILLIKALKIYIKNNS